MLEHSVKKTGKTVKKSRARKDNRDSVCFDCAEKMGFKLARPIVGVWTGKCEFCRKDKPLTSLSHDWKFKHQEDQEGEGQ